MKTRIITALACLPILFFALYFYNSPFFNIIVAALCVLAFYEIISAFKVRRPGWLYTGIVPVALILFLSDYERMRRAIPLILFLFVLYLVICVVFEFRELSFAQAGQVLIFCGYVLYGFYSIISFKILFPFDLYGYDSLYLILLGLGFAWGGDSCAYFVGRAFGRHKLAPRVSPNKTVEGAVGGILGSVLLGCLFTLLYAQLLPVVGGSGAGRVTGASYLMVCCVGAVASVLGILGDLFTSAIKRQCGIKDYGSIFPGHGGILDRFDSVLLVMPFLSLICRVLPFVRH